VYNGLTWRIMKQAHTDGARGADQQRVMHYSARWQLLKDDVWDAWTAQTPGASIGTSSRSAREATPTK